MANILVCYRAFVLRVWQERGSGPAETAACRYSLEDPHSGERHGFATIEAMCAFLHSQMAQGQPEARV